MLPARLLAHPRHALVLAHDVAAGSDPTTTTAAAVWVWSSLEPTAALLLRPLTIWAGERSLLRSTDEADKTWASTQAELRRLAVGLDELAAPFAPRRWSTTRRDEQVAARQAYLAGLSAIDPVELGRRVRALRLQNLLGAVAKKTKGTAQAPLARTALIKALQPTLSAYCGGHWPTLLTFAGLTPHPSEEIVTALPDTHLLVGTDDATVADIASEQNLATGEVEAILAAYLGTQPRQRSPIEERIETITRWWQAFDCLHATQRPGQPALWGLVDEGMNLIALNNPQQAIPRLYRSLMPTDLVADVDRLWGGLTLPQWPENIVSEPHPHRLMVEAIGPALSFWNGVALTAWYETEGPYSRTTLDRIATYHQRDLAALDELGHPVDPTLFDELTAVAETFGEPEPVAGPMNTVELGEGHSVEHWTGSWQRREGFERARDIITRHRRAWTTTHLDAYLAARWREGLTQAAQRYQRHLATKGKAPTFKQFSRMAATAANHWFGGDLSGIYRAMGESAPHTPRRVDFLPVDAYQFALTVYVGLGGQFVDNSWETVSALGDDYGRLWALARLAAKSICYIQLCEAMGRTPEPKRVIADDIWAQIWPGGIGEGWPAFTEYVDELRHTEPDQFPEIPSLIAAATPAPDPQRPDPRHPDGSNIIRVVFGERVIAPTWRAPDDAGYAYRTVPSLELAVGDHVLVPTHEDPRPQSATIIALTPGDTGFDGPLANISGRAR